MCPVLLSHREQPYMIGFIVPSQNALLAMVEQMQVRGTFEEICKNLLIEKEVLRVITEVGLRGKVKINLNTSN